MFKFGNSILKTEYIKKEAYRKEIMISTVLSSIFIAIIIALAAAFSDDSISTDIEDTYRKWEPKTMFLGTTVLGSSQPLTINEDELVLGDKVFDITASRYEKTLPNGAVVFIFNVESGDSEEDKKEFPFIRISKDESILQLGKVGMSYTK